MFFRNSKVRGALAATAMFSALSVFGGPVTAGPGDLSCATHKAACMNGGSNPNWVRLGWSPGKCAASFAACQGSCQQSPNSGNWPAWDGSGGMYPASCPATGKGPKT